MTLLEKPFGDPGGVQREEQEMLEPKPKEEGGDGATGGAAKTAKKSAKKPAKK